VEATESTDAPLPSPPPSSSWSATERALLLSIALCAAVALQQLAAMLRRI